MNKTFNYQGFNFEPIRSLLPSENDISYISTHLYTEKILGMSLNNFAWVKREWNFETFKELSPDPAADIYICHDNGLYYIPMKNELFGWKE